MAVDEEITQYLTYQTVNSFWQVPFVNSANATAFVPQGTALQWGGQDTRKCDVPNKGARLQVVTSPGNNSSLANTTANPPMVLTVTNGTIYRNYTAVLSPGSMFATPGYLALAVGEQWRGCSSVISGHWIRVRPLPPNGTMPSASFGRAGPGWSNISFQETGLSSGIKWSVTLTDTRTNVSATYSSTRPWLNETLPWGPYDYLIQALGYPATHIHPSRGSFKLGAAGWTKTIVFT